MSETNLIKFGECELPVPMTNCIESSKPHHYIQTGGRIMHGHSCEYEAGFIRKFSLCLPIDGSTKILWAETWYRASELPKSYKEEGGRVMRGWRRYIWVYDRLCSALMDKYPGYFHTGAGSSSPPEIYRGAEPRDD